MIINRILIGFVNGKKILKKKKKFFFFIDLNRIEIKNKKTGNIKCFAVNRLLSQKASDGATKILLTIHSNYPCDKAEHELHDLAKNIAIEDRSSPLNKIQNLAQQRYHSPNKREFTKKYIITTKTGNKILSGTDANVFIRLYDDQNRQSKDILLEQTVTNKNPFDKHAIDEFHTGTLENLSDLQKIHLWYTGGKNQAWKVEWVQIEDVDTNRLYCFPVVGKTNYILGFLLSFFLKNKWLDLNSDDKTTHVELTEFTVNEPCSIILDRKDQKNLQRSTITYDDEESRKTNQTSQFKRTYHVETKTGKRGFLGLSPTGKYIKFLSSSFIDYERYKCKSIYANT